MASLFSPLILLFFFPLFSLLITLFLSLSFLMMATLFSQLIVFFFLLFNSFFPSHYIFFLRLSCPALSLSLIFLTHSFVCVYIYFRFHLLITLSSFPINHAGLQGILFSSHYCIPSLSCSVSFLSFIPRLVGVCFVRHLGGNSFLYPSSFFSPFHFFLIR